MADYISREAAIECAKHAYAKGLEPAQYIEEIPAADVEPVRHGRWVEHKPGEQHRLNACIECSKCNIWFWYDCFAKTNYCPNCGAKMERDARTVRKGGS